MNQNLTLEDASRITGRPIKTRYDGVKLIEWSTDRHDMTVQMVKTFDGSGIPHVAVFGEPKPWPFGGEVRKGRPKQISVYNATESYLKRLKAAASEKQ